MKRQFLAIPLLLLSFCFIFSSKSFATEADCDYNTHPDYVCGSDTLVCSNKNTDIWSYVQALDDNGIPIMCGPMWGDTLNHPCCIVSDSVKDIVGFDTCVNTYSGFCNAQSNNCVSENATQVKNGSVPVACDATQPCCRYNNVTGTDNLCYEQGGTCLQNPPTTYAYTILTSPPGCTIGADSNDPFCNLCAYNNESCYKPNTITYCGEGKLRDEPHYRDETTYTCRASDCLPGHLKWDPSADGELRPCRQGSSYVCCTNFDTTGSEQANPNRLFCTPGNGNESSGINTAIGCIPVGSGNELIAFILRLATGLGGGIALALILYGVFIVTTSAGMPDKLKAGSNIITSAVVGLIFILLSIFLVNLIGINILGIPGLS